MTQPFDPPRDPSTPTPPSRAASRPLSDSGRGPWRDGALLVVHTRSRPGDLTWRDGKDATSTLRTTLTWHPGWVWATLVLGVLPYFLVRALTLRRVRVTAPAHAATQLQRWLALSVAVGLVIAGVAVLFAFPTVFVLITLFLRAAVIAIAWGWPLVRVRHIESNRAWIAVHPDVLAGLPELPRSDA